MEYIGKEQSITIGGKPYTLGRMTRKIMGEYLAWAETVLPKPLDQIKGAIEGFSPAIQELIVKEMIAKVTARRTFNSPDVQELLQTPEGMFKLFALLLKERHGDLTEEQVGTLFDKYLDEEGDRQAKAKLDEAFVKCAGDMPKSESDIEIEAMQEFGVLPSNPNAKKKNATTKKTG